MAGPYIARKVTTGIGKSVGLAPFKGQCAALVQWFGGAPKTHLWRAGKQIKGCAAGDIAKFTCIATFEGGIYPNRAHGNHAAVYITHDDDGIEVYDQWVGRPIGKRKIAFKAGSDMSDPSNNGNCFYVIL